MEQGHKFYRLRTTQVLIKDTHGKEHNKGRELVPK